MAVKILAVAGSAFAAILGLFGVLAHRFFHECVHDGIDGRTHELGQLFGLVQHDADTPMGIYRPNLTWLPELAQPLLARLLHLEAWLGALVCLPLLFLLTSLALDWAVGDVARPEDDYL